MYSGGTGGQGGAANGTTYPGVQGTALAAGGGGGGAGSKSSAYTGADWCERRACSRLDIDGRNGRNGWTGWWNRH